MQGGAVLPGRTEGGCACPARIPACLWGVPAHILDPDQACMHANPAPLAILLHRTTCKLVSQHAPRPQAQPGQLRGRRRQGGVERRTAAQRQGERHRLGERAQGVKAGAMARGRCCPPTWSQSQVSSRARSRGRGRGRAAATGGCRSSCWSRRGARAVSCSRSRSRSCAMRRPCKQAAAKWGPQAKGAHSHCPCNTGADRRGMKAEHHRLAGAVSCNTRVTWPNRVSPLMARTHYLVPPACILLCLTLCLNETAGLLVT